MVTMAPEHSTPPSSDADAFAGEDGSLERCPCCNNPWTRPPKNQNAEDFLAGLLACSTCALPKEPADKDDDGSSVGGLSRSNRDENVAPSDNFYLYANGGWIQQNPIPPGYPSWNTFTVLHVQSQEHCKAILEDLKKEKPKDANENEAAKVAAFFEAAMDEEAVEQDGIQSLKPVLVLVDDIVASLKEAKSDCNYSRYSHLLGQLQARYGISAFFGMSASPDAKNPDHTICQLSQGGLGLPDRDYYLQDDKEEQRHMYVQHVTNLLQLLYRHLGRNDDGAIAAEQQGRRILELETELARSHMTRTENRDPHATYNVTTLTQLTADTQLDWKAYWRASFASPDEAKDAGPVNVRNTKALQETARLIAAEMDPEDLRAWLYFKCASSCAPYLPDDFVQEHFDFHERKLAGTQELKPRWKRAMAWTESALGEALGKLYCAKHFDEDCKTRAYAIVEQVRQALEARLKEVEWITADSTRQQALEKMSRFRIKIGYPNKWIDYGALEIRGSFLDMVLAARAFDHKRTVKEMNAPTDREKWFMTPQTVNAYYHPTLNEVVFPAAILQHPFFDREADDAVNFGAIGAVVGHEMTHGFDDKGRKFDAHGHLRDWWTPEDATEYERRVEAVVKQANDFVVHGQSVQGQLTSGENIADLGGLRLALRALKAQAGFDPEARIGGLTPVQRFFLAWAQCWRQNITKERALQLVVLDPHGPNELRCNGPLSNLSEFHDAFGVGEKSPMFRPVEERVDIW